MSVNPIKVINKIIDVQDRVGEFIAGPDRDGLAGHIQQQYRKRCDQAANIPTWLTNLSTPARETLSNYCSPWYAQRGFDGFEPNPPLVNGGQCPGRLYDCIVRISNPDTGAPVTIVRNGEVGPIVLVPDGDGRSCPDGTFFNERYRFTANGVIRFSFNGNNCGAFPSIPSVDCTPRDGLPDECGDQPNPDAPLRPGPNPPPDPGPTPGPEPTDDPTGSPFPELPIPDFPSPFGDFPVIAPPDDPVPVDPTTIPPTGGDGLPGLPDAVGAPAGETSGGEDGEEIGFGTPPEGRIWVGCSVEATVDPRLGNIPGTGPTNPVYAFVIGNVALKYGSFYGTSKRINSRFTLVGRETTAVVLDGCFVQAQPGVTLVVRPISAETCPEPTCST